MNITTQILFLLLTTTVSCQNVKKSDSLNSKNTVNTTSQSDNCKKGKLDAIKDFENGQLGYYFFGHPNPEFNTWVRIIKEEYNITTKGGGDIIFEEGECYNDIMEIKLKAKYGEHVFDRINQKVDSLYEIGLGDRNAEYTGGEDALLKHIYCNLKDDLLKEENQKLIIIAQLIINEQGKTKIDTLSLRNISEEEIPIYKSEVNKLIDKMPNWIPAIQNKEEIENRYTIPIKFSKQEKLKNCG